MESREAEDEDEEEKKHGVISLSVRPTLPTCGGPAVVVVVVEFWFRSSGPICVLSLMIEPADDGGVHSVSRSDGGGGGVFLFTTTTVREFYVSCNRKKTGSASRQLGGGAAAAERGRGEVSPGALRVRRISFCVPPRPPSTRLVFSVLVRARGGPEAEVARGVAWHGLR